MSIEPVSGIIFGLILVGGYIAIKIKTSKACMK